MKLNSPNPMNTYHAFFSRRQIEIKAETALAAQKAAAVIFKARKSYEVAVVLVGRADGSPVIHSTSTL